MLLYVYSNEFNKCDNKNESDKIQFNEYMARKLIHNETTA